MFFDDYAGVSDLPENDLPGWLARGADIDEWRTDRLVADLTALVGGGSILSLDGASIDRTRRHDRPRRTVRSGPESPSDP